MDGDASAGLLFKKESVDGDGNVVADEVFVVVVADGDDDDAMMITPKATTVNIKRMTKNES